MRLITKQKQVNFHGIMVWVPECASSLYADEDGNVFYRTRYQGLIEGIYICTVDLEGLTGVRH